MEPSAPPSPRRRQIAQAVAAIEHELRTLGVWQQAPPAPDRLDFHAAFGADKLSFFEWLQWVLIARVQAILAAGSEFPRGSEVGTYAVRELDGCDGADQLVGRLQEFDRLFADPAEATAGPFANHDEFVAHVVQQGVITEQELTVRAFLIAMQVGNPAAARAQLTPPQRDDDSFVPTPPFPIYDFRVQRPLLQGDCAIAHTEIAGTGGDGNPARQSMPFVLVEHEGHWRIDIPRSVAMLLTGDPHGGAAAVESKLDEMLQGVASGMASAMQGVAEATSSALAGAAAGEFAAAVAGFEASSQPRRQAELAGRFGAQLRLIVDTSGLAREPRLLRELDRFVGDELLPAVAMMDSPALLALREGLHRIVIAFSARRGERGAFRHDGELRLVLHPGLDPEFQSAPTWCRMLELAANPELTPRYHFANERLGHWQDLLAERHGLQFTFHADWQRFTGSPDAQANAWALQVLVEHGIDPLGSALDTALSANPRLLEPTRAWLRQLRISRIGTPTQRSLVRSDDATICCEMFVLQGFDDCWTATELRDRLVQLLAAAAG